MSDSVAGALLLALLPMLALAGCSGNGDDDLRVFAASSLTDVFADLIEAFGETQSGTGVDVQLVVGGSSSLVTQISEGADAHVLATANTETMSRLEQDTDFEAVVFATNSMVVVVEPMNPLGLVGIDDLEREDLLVAVCGPQVPCGSLAQRVLDQAGVSLSPATLEPNVRSVLTKVQLGEVDAGLVYRTDADGANVETIPSGTEALVNEYPIANLADTPAATDFVRFVLSADGQSLLTAAGFGTPN